MTKHTQTSPKNEQISSQNKKQAGLPGIEKNNGEIQKPQLPFTLEQVRKAIPAECFEKNLGKSVYYMIRDWVIIYALYMTKDYFFVVPFLGKFVWWNLVGFFFWAMFVVAHDCGHTTFSNYKLINDICGILCNAPILVPFKGWATSHRKHHSYHNNIEKDHSWTPLDLDQYNDYGWAKYVRYTPLMLLAYPYYLMKESQTGGFSGNHFNPWSPLFKPSERIEAAVSAIAVVAWLVYLFKTFEFSVLLDLYFPPYLIFCCWLDLVTYLQHSDEKVFYYRDEVWDYFTGAFSTIDRNYGSIVNHFMHNIETHVVHHIFFTQIPHYNLVKATNAVKDMFGEYYIKDESFVPFSFFRSLKQCVVVPNKGNGDVVKYESYDYINRENAKNAKKSQ